ncbi:ATP-dependent DNA ligase [Sinomonas notoginsengisoli]|uniref:ATP-dependent DNA ligase n=1 Tax=Sinomonas notoginsengisoli TaxID=1457311 RepID=UPI001F42E873|nr:ATP-dependent DNA ligase [Sinomonas notoginsengisoli]
MAAGSSLPRSLRPPLELALAKAVQSVPPEGALPGGCRYEPKWDGFRILIAVDEDGASLWSRQGKDLTRTFPDLAQAAAAMVPPGFLIDGEAVVWNGGRLDFDALQRRNVTSRAGLADLVRAHPASFAAFDILAVAGQDTRGLKLADRRALLAELAAGWSRPLSLSPATADRDEAIGWMEDMHPSGIEGLVVKGAGQRYEPGVRQWLKVKQRDTLDVVVAAVTGTMDRPSALIAGLPIDGKLRIVGRTGPLAASAARSVAPHLREPIGVHPWPEEVPRSWLDRFAKEKGPVHLTRIEPIVVEISADTAWSGTAFRHALGFVRARPELDPADITLPEQLARG